MRELIGLVEWTEDDYWNSVSWLEEDVVEQLESRSIGSKEVGRQP